MESITYHLRDCHLRLLHPFPFHTREAAEAFRDYLGNDDEIVEVPIKVLDDEVAENAELDAETEREIAYDKYQQKWGE